MLKYAKKETIFCEITAFIDQNTYNLFKKLKKYEYRLKYARLLEKNVFWRFLLLCAKRELF